MSTFSSNMSFFRFKISTPIQWPRENILSKKKTLFFQQKKKVKKPINVKNFDCQQKDNQPRSNCIQVHNQLQIHTYIRTSKSN